MKKPKTRIKYVQGPPGPPGPQGAQGAAGKDADSYLGEALERESRVFRRDLREMRSELEALFKYLKLDVKVEPEQRVVIKRKRWWGL